jgi:hypothetical protein
MGRKSWMAKTGSASMVGASSFPSGLAVVEVVVEIVAKAKARQGKARQGKARQGKTRPEQEQRQRQQQQQQQQQQ